MEASASTRRRLTSSTTSSRHAPPPPRQPRSRGATKWCCSFTVPPSSPETRPERTRNALYQKSKLSEKEKARDSFSKLSSTNSIPNSPLSSKSGLSIVGRIDPRRILSPGRVSPIDSDPIYDQPDPSLHLSVSVEVPVPRSRPGSFRGSTEASQAVPEAGTGSGSVPGVNVESGFDVRLNLKGKNGGCLVLEMSSEVLCENSEVFGGLVRKYRNGLGENGSGCCSSSICRIEVPEVENLGVFRETIELMFEEDITKRLVKIGVYRCIDILEVAAGIVFSRGVLSCFKYLEAVPWTEEEEEKLRSLFSRIDFDEATTSDIMARLYTPDAVSPRDNLVKRLFWSVTSCTDANARIELKSLLKGLLGKSSVYVKDHSDLTKEDIYEVCHSCLGSLVNLFEEASSSIPLEKLNKNEADKPLIERISRQVDNINWLLEILLDRQMAEEFVEIWMGQSLLIKMHENTSPMIRYELSRISAVLLIAMGTRKLHCRSEARAGIFQGWFGPMLSDFGWLQRCRKGLEMKLLEEAMGQTLLTLPLKQQYILFMEWFRCFSKQGTECPNLSKAFQIWWRRSFLRGSESHSIESR